MRIAIHDFGLLPVSPGTHGAFIMASLRLARPWGQPEIPRKKRPARNGPNSANRINNYASRTTHLRPAKTHLRPIKWANPASKWHNETPLGNHSDGFGPTSTLQTSKHLLTIGAMTETSPRMSGTERRSQLIEVAIDLFARRGFAGTTTREIAAAAGVTEAIIFRHFATKEDLYKAILDARCNCPEAQTWFAETQQFMDNNDDKGLFRLLISKIIEGTRKDPAFQRLMLHASLEGHELALMHHNQFKMPIGAQFIAYIAKRQQEGALRQCDPVAAIFAVAGIAQYYASQKYLYQPCPFSLTDEEAIESFLAILMKGLRS